jgi:hypothetical protein
MEVTTMSRFKDMPQDPDQMWLMPPGLDKMVPRDSEVRLLCEVMDQMDWSIPLVRVKGFPKELICWKDWD